MKLLGYYGNNGKCFAVKKSGKWAITFYMDLGFRDVSGFEFDSVAVVGSDMGSKKALTKMKDPVTKTLLCGVYDYAAKKQVLPHEYADINIFAGYAVTPDGAMHVIDTDWWTTEQVTPPSVDDGMFPTKIERLNDGYYAVVIRNGYKLGVAKDCRWVAPPVYGNMRRDRCQGVYFDVSFNGKPGYIDMYGMVVDNNALHPKKRF